MKLVVDINLSEEVLSPGFCEPNILALLLSKSKIDIFDMPLEEKICLDFGLQANGDYPVAAIAANVDGIDVQSGYWLRCDPVHFMMQRDAFALASPLPIKLPREASTAIIETLNSHFQPDGLLFVLGDSGNWYVSLDLQQSNPPSMKTSMPHAALQKNVQHFFPKGDDAKQWIAIQNEIQMLLFDHAVNQDRESRGEVLVNSVWFSGGGQMPQVDKDLVPKDYSVIADTPLHEGLAKYSNMNFAKRRTVDATSAFEKLMNISSQDIRLSIPQDAYIEEWFALLHDCLKRNKMTHLVLNIGWYERTICATVNKASLFQFWRKVQALSNFLT